MVCGDFKEAFKKYDRQRTSIMSSNVAVAGSLNAFTQNMTLVRAIERNDYKVLDNEAYTNLKMVIDDASVKGEE
jgi:HK97 family phage major capsid protein